VLRSQRQVDIAEETVRKLGLAPSPERVKSWDNLLAIRSIAGLGLKADSPIVDLGCRSGILITWLDQLGYRNLHGCDLQAPFPPIRSALRARLWPTVVAGARAYARNYTRMHRAPVEATGFQENSFSAVTSMSVIEHGVDLPRFFTEAARLLRPGGLLVVSTDYWPTLIDVGQLRRFELSHGRDRIFDRSGANQVWEMAKTAGLEGPRLDLDADVPVISSSGFEYTFLLLSFVRPAL
jgi:SAM-dependent methyltransferase